ncbi:hypothetical protein [Perlabentimonas gracilis]|nr:hypothetical protein [Perlabentimonas gracilis]
MSNLKTRQKINSQPITRGVTNLGCMGYGSGSARRELFNVG